MFESKTNRGHARPVFAKRYFTVPRREIAYLRFILESYDGLAFMRTLDSVTGLIEVAFPAERLADVGPLLADLAAETGMCEVAAPATIPPL